MSAPTWLDPVIQPRRTFNALDYMAGDGSDESAGMRLLFAARAAITGDVAIYFPAPPVSYHVISAAPGGTNATVIAGVGSDTLIYGDGAGSLIKWTGVSKIDDVGNTHNTGSQQLFNLTGARILIRDLTIQGDNDPFVAYSNNQSAAVKAKSTDVVVRDVTFANLVGFIAADDFTGAGRNHMMRCTLDHCANGTNFGSDYSIQFRNKYITTEGIEYAGVPGVIALNDMRGGGISAGGNNDPGARKPGTIVVANSIDSSALGVALITAEAYVNGWVQGNVVGRARDIAIQIGSSTPALYDSNTVVDNYADGGRIGLEIVSLARFTMVASNVRLHGASVGAEVRADDVSLLDNRMTSGTGGAKDIILQSTAQGARLIGNTYTTLDAKAGSTQVSNPTRPTGVEVRVDGDVRNGFATVQVRNWDQAGSVSLPDSALSGSGLKPGDVYEIRHPYYLLADEPYQEGLYTGKPVDLEMREVAPPEDWTVSTTQQLPILGPKFNAFMLFRVRHAPVHEYATIDGFSELPSAAESGGFIDVRPAITVGLFQ